jgi:hypothetical protein
MSWDVWMNEPAAEPVVVAVWSTVLPQTEHGGPLTSVAISYPHHGGAADSVLSCHKQQKTRRNGVGFNTEILSQWPRVVETNGARLCARQTLCPAARSPRLLSCLL